MLHAGGDVEGADLRVWVPGFAVYDGLVEKDGVLVEDVLCRVRGHVDPVLDGLGEVAAHLILRFQVVDPGYCQIQLPIAF